VDPFATITCDVSGPVATVTLNRPEARNALSNAMIADLLRCFSALQGVEYDAVRAVVLRAAGTTFCAGGDVRDLASGASPEEDRAALATFDQLLRCINETPQVVVARVHGPVVGGGVGLVSVCDIAVAAESASFAFSEARLGLAPSLVAPYVLARIGFTAARRLVLTGARFPASAAQALGLVSDCCRPDDLDDRVNAVLRDILLCAPRALRECKRLLFHVAATADSLEYRIALLTRLRSDEEAHQGIAALLTKQPAPWVPTS
jgi:methylglutaconyl-CoA hydratase